MAYAVETRANNPANYLRDALAEAEDLVIKPNAQNIETLLSLLDRIEKQFDELSQNGSDLRPEESRWHSLVSRISSKPQPLAAAAAAAGGMAKLRAQHPPAESFWWRLDEEVYRRRIETTRRMTITIGSIVIGLLLVYWGITYLFPPSEETLLMFDTTSRIEEFAANQEWDNALEVVDETKQKLPDNPELLLWETVMAERAGDQNRAQASLAYAQELLPDQITSLWVTLGQLRLQFGDLEGAADAANRALALNPDEAQAVFLLAGVAESNGDYFQAIELFQKTFDLAEADDPQLAVIARVRMGSLMQNPFSSPIQEPD